MEKPIEEEIVTYHAVIASLMAFIEYKGLIGEYADFSIKFNEYLENDDSGSFDFDKFVEYIEGGEHRDA